MTRFAEPMAGTMEYWAREKPDEVAAIDGDLSLTWSELDHMANRLAHGLLARGIGADDVVALRTKVRHEWIIISCALAKIGAAQVGVNFRLTPTEVEFVLRDSGARALFCDDADPFLLSPVLDTLSIDIRVSLDVPAPGFIALSQACAEGVPPLYSGGDSALIVYTSGTTGQPKGVLMNRATHGANQAMLEYMADVRDRSSAYTPEDVVLVSMPMHHGSGPAQVRGALRAGARMVLQRRFDPEGTLAQIQRYGVSRWTGVPTMYKRMAALPEEVLGRYRVDTLKSLTVGAAPVTTGLKSWIIATFGNILSESYGSTELGIISSLAPDMQLKKPGSSGLPHRHVDIQVRDEQGNILPTGEVGELWIRTPVAIRNYLNQPALGRDIIDEDGYFDSGDMGRLDEDGYLYITDRSKDMIISGGVNIYPAEIEAVLLEHPAVMDVAVIGVPDEEFGESVKAFCELKPGRRASVEELFEHCLKDLASYKRPKSIEVVKELPRNALGKLLKRELRTSYWNNQERNV